MARTQKRLPSLLKWIGNKMRFADEIIDYMPESIDTYIEPFLGSGAVLGTLSYRAMLDKQPSLLSMARYKKAIAGDTLSLVIDIFNYVKNDPKTIINHYEQCIRNFHEDNKKSRYETIKARFNEHRNPLDFAVLTRTCYSGIIRFRKSDGYMSTPVGPHKPISPAKFAERVNLWHKLIQDVEFITADFRDTMHMGKSGDVIYCDPPYTDSQSILYGAQEFNIEDLWDSIYMCKQRGCLVLLSIDGMKKSKSNNVNIRIPKGLFERSVYVNCGVSMINRLQRNGQVMLNEDVHDRLLLTW